MQTNEISINSRLKDLGIFTGRNSKMHVVPGFDVSGTFDKVVLYQGITETIPIADKDKPLHLNREGMPIGKWHNLTDPANPIVIS